MIHKNACRHEWGTDVFCGLERSVDLHSPVEECGPTPCPVPDAHHPFLARRKPKGRKNS